MRQAAEAIKAGEVVCIFPEGELARTGMLLRLKRGYALLARTAGAARRESLGGRGRGSRRNRTGYFGRRIAAA